MAGPITFQSMPALTNASAADMPTHLGAITGTIKRSNDNFAAINAWVDRRLRSLSQKSYHESGTDVATPDAHWTIQDLQGYRVPLAGTVSLCTVFGQLLYVSPTNVTTNAGSGDLTADIPLYTPTPLYMKTISDTTWIDYFPVAFLDSGSPLGCYGGIAAEVANGTTQLVKVSMPGLVISKAAGTQIRFTHTYLTGASA